MSLWNPNAIIAGSAAAALTFDPSLRPREILVYAKGTLADRGPLRFRRDRIDPALTTWRNGIRMTGHVGTVLTAGLEGDLATGTTALRHGLVRPEDIAEHAASWTARRAPQARSVAHALSGNPWSVAEVEAHELFRSAGIRGWEGNQEVWLCGHRFVPDISIPATRTAFEVNSYEYHSSPDALERDGTRLNAFISAGWRSYSLTPRQIRDHPAEAIEFVRSVVWRRHRRLRTTSTGGDG